MLTLDGSQGEGGGQILRTALALSLVTRTPFRIENIRARRQKGGLLRQHLAAVRAAKAIGQARVEGDELGSRALTFVPGDVVPGSHEFDVGSAGSAMLVMQTVLPPLLIASQPSRLTLRGGTHNPTAPPFDYIERAFLPIVNRLGVRVQAMLLRHGFYPAGGGHVEVKITPAPKLARLQLLDRGPLVRRRVCAVTANLPRHIAEREVTTALDVLGWEASEGEVVELEDVIGPGNAVMIELESANVTEIYTGFAQRGVRAEAVARKPADEVRRYLDAAVPVGCNLADQLLTIAGLGGGAEFRTLPLTEHSTTNADVVRMFTGVTMTTIAEAGDVVRVEMR
jgi:RNA 3'-terminal phosphate cyclase (ATP)